MVQYKGQPRTSEAEKAWMALVKQQPCIYHELGTTLQTTPTEVNHLKLGNMRMGHFYVLPACQECHRKVHRFKRFERALWEILNERLGITDRAWPTSKIIARRAS